MAPGPQHNPLSVSQTQIPSPMFGETSGRRSSLDWGIAGLVFLATFLLCIFPLMDTDFWWHLRTGELIWQRGTVPQLDWYLFTDSNQPWVDLHWGFQLLVAALYHLGGVNLVILVKSLVIASAVGIAWSAVGNELPAWLRAVVWIPALICISGRGYERPEMMSQLFLAMWLWIACRAETYPKTIWLLPVIQGVWINFHALYILGLVVGGCFALDYLVRWIANGRWGLANCANNLNGASVFGAGILCALAALVNPYVIQGALFPLVLYRKFSVEQEFYSTRIGEFQRPFSFFLRYGYASVYLDAQLILSWITCLSFVALLVIARKWSVFRLLLFMAFFHLGWEASRNVNIFSFVAATLTIANLVDIQRYLLSHQANNSRGKVVHAAFAGSWIQKIFSVDFAARGNVLITLGLVIWMIMIVTSFWGRFTREKKVFALGERPWWFAHEAVQFAGQPGFPARAYISHIGIAATYEYHHGPEKKVYMDPRLEVATQKTFQRWEQIQTLMSRGDRSWEPQLRDSQGQLPVVILDSRASRGAINGLFQTPGWRMVYADYAAAVFLSEPQAQALNLPVANPEPLKYPP